MSRLAAIKCGDQLAGELEVEIQSAVLEDVEGIRTLVGTYATEKKMLPRSAKELEETIDEYCVAKDEEGRVVGCCALHVYSQEWAEVKAVAVAEEWQGKGIGRSMVNDRIRLAQQKEIRRLFCLTYVPEVFAKHGFELIPKEALPHKIWAECIRCSKFSDCDEIAMALSLDGKPLR